MCGRVVTVSSTELLAARFHVDEVTAEHVPSWNVAPSRDLLAIIDHDGHRRLGPLRWGYVPSWSDDATRGVRPINARAEGAAGSRMFRDALARRRCVVPIDGWYEWREREGSGTKRAFHLALEPAGPFAVAALRSTWRGTPDSPPLHTVALMTTAARGAAAAVHDRMPLIVPDGMLDDWLDPAATDPSGLLAVVAATEAPVVVTEVSTRVNRVGTDGPELVAPLGPGEGATGDGAPADGARRDRANGGAPTPGGASGGAGR